MVLEKAADVDRVTFKFHLPWEGGRVKAGLVHKKRPDDWQTWCGLFLNGHSGHARKIYERSEGAVTCPECIANAG